MAIRVRPADVEVPQDDPFQNDLLDRKPYIEDLTGLLAAVEGPCVLALDSEWGGGKTTFLNMWAAHLRNNSYSVAQFNAWETDFSGDPFVALSSKLYEHFSESTRDGEGRVKRYMEAAKKVAVQSAPIMISLATMLATGSGALSGELATQITSFAEKRLAGFSENQKSITNFRDILQQEVSGLYESGAARPLFIMIDELDRCRPSYAIELLEVAKHLFSVDRIVFVLAINRSQLAHSVKALYGSEFDANGYLCRFFDLDYSLPTPERDKFVLQLMGDTGIGEEILKDLGSLQIVPNVIACVLACSELDLRRIAQTIHRLVLICGSLNTASPALTTAAAVLLAFRETRPDVYNEFVDGTTDDASAIEQFYARGNLGEMEFTNEGFFFEAIVCQAWFELASGAGRHLNDWDDSRLYKSYSSAVKHTDEKVTRERISGVRSGLSQDDERRYKRAKGVMNACHGLQSYADDMRFAAAIRRIALLPISQ